MPAEAERPPGQASDASMIALMQQALDALRGTIERLERQADQAEARAAAADARAERAEQDKRRAEAALSAERARADALRTTIQQRLGPVAPPSSSGASRAWSMDGSRGSR
jgi:hypothetical protein